MLTRASLAVLALLGAPMLAPADAVAAPRHHHAARVSIATYRTSKVHKPVRELRAGHRHAAPSRLAATQPRPHPLSRGS